MYGGFADAKLFRGGADGGIVADDVVRQVAGALFDTRIHIHHSPIHAWFSI